MSQCELLEPVYNLTVIKQKVACRLTIPKFLLQIMSFFSTYLDKLRKNTKFSLKISELRRISEIVNRLLKKSPTEPEGIEC